MYRATGDIWDDIASTAGGIVGGIVNQPSGQPAPGQPVATKEPIYCPEQAALMATAYATFPNDSVKRDIFLLTNGPGFATTGGWAGWCALKKAGLAPGTPSHQPPPITMGTPMTPAIGTTATPWTTYAAIGAGVLGLAGLVWYMKK